jgi:hypothetical protein
MLTTLLPVLALGKLSKYSLIVLAVVVVLIIILKVKEGRG